LEELQFTIRRAGGGLLGDTEEVRPALDGHYAGIAWAWTSTGVQRLAAADAAGLELPPAVLRVIESQPSVLCGEVKTAGVRATFNLGPGGPVPVVWATVGGDEAAVAAAMSRLRSLRGWSVGPAEGWLITEAEQDTQADGSRDPGS
jgi:hypothetical protein